MVYGGKREGIWGKSTVKNKNIKKRKAIDSEKIFPIHISDKRLKSRNTNN